MRLPTATETTLKVNMRASHARKTASSRFHQVPARPRHGGGTRQQARGEGGRGERSSSAGGAEGGWSVAAATHRLEGREVDQVIDEARQHEAELRGATLDAAHLQRRERGRCKARYGGDTAEIWRRSGGATGSRHGAPARCPHDASSRLAAMSASCRRRPAPPRPAPPRPVRSPPRRRAASTAATTSASAAAAFAAAAAAAACCSCHRLPQLRDQH